MNAHHKLKNTSCNKDSCNPLTPDRSAFEPLNQVDSLWRTLITNILRKRTPDIVAILAMVTYAILSFGIAGIERSLTISELMVVTIIAGMVLAVTWLVHQFNRRQYATTKEKHTDETSQSGDE